MACINKNNSCRWLCHFCTHRHVNDVGTHQLHPPTPRTGEWRRRNLSASVMYVLPSHLLVIICTNIPSNILNVSYTLFFIFHSYVFSSS